MNVVSACSLAALALFASAGHASAPLLVHEWGTFTSFQDNRGRTISGINVDDEPVPAFVHRVADSEIFTTRSLPASWLQGAPACHPEVTLRLETPVLYFYPQPAFDRTQRISVEAAFTGGWLTEFYPNANADTPGFPDELHASTRGSLRWTDLQLVSGAAPELPKTQEHVWLAPRDVASSIVVDPTHKEAEKYLFYRGVGHLDAPIVVHREGHVLTISLREGEKAFDRWPAMWVAQVVPDGRVHYQKVDGGGERSARVSLATWSDARGNELDALKTELANELRAEGLFDDEARAMLATWRLSYFDSEGLRVFFVLPRSWTDARLPLSLSVSADITRVMLGRVELTSDHQQAALRQLLALPDSELAMKPIYAQSTEAARLVRDHSHSEIYQKLNREVPRALQLYESLGRFRDALLAHELAAANDDAVRKRLERVMAVFSACHTWTPAGQGGL